MNDLRRRGDKEWQPHVCRVRKGRRWGTTGAPDINQRGGMKYFAGALPQMPLSIIVIVIVGCSGHGSVAILVIPDDGYENFQMLV